MKCNKPIKKRKTNDDEISLFFTVIGIIIVFVAVRYINNEILPEVEYEMRINNINSILIGKDNKNCSMPQNFKLDINFCHIKGSRESNHE